MDNRALRSTIKNPIALDDTSACGDDQSTKIFCANCIHCKLVQTPAQTEGTYYLRVRCDAGKWRKKLGEEKIHKYFTVARRSIPSCDSYEDMGESDDFIHDLKQSLPDSDEVYSL